MKNRLIAYKGDEDYTFISYAHKDFEQVNEILCEVNDLGYNLWYDEGIDPGNEWAEEIAYALFKSKLFIVFVSNNAMNSKNVINECFYALDNGIPFLAVFLEEAEYTKGLSLRASSTQAIMKYRMSNEDFYNKLSSTMKMMLSDTYENTDQSIYRGIDRKKPKRLIAKKISIPVMLIIAIGIISAVAYSLVLLTNLTSELYSLKNQPEQQQYNYTLETTIIESSLTETEETLAENLNEIESKTETTTSNSSVSKNVTVNNVQTSTTSSLVSQVETTTGNVIKDSVVVEVGYGITEKLFDNGEFEVTVTREFLPLYAQYATKLRVHGNSLEQSVSEVFNGINSPSYVSQMNGDSYPQNNSLITFRSNDSYYNDHFITLASDEEVLLMVHVKGGKYYDSVENDILSFKNNVAATEATTEANTPINYTFSGTSVNDLKEAINLSYGINNVLDRTNFGFTTTVVRDKLPSYAQQATNLSVWGNTDSYDIQTAFNLLVDGDYWKRNFNRNFLPPLTKSYFNSNASYYDNHFVILSNDEKVLMLIQIKDQEQFAILENN